MEAYNKYKAKIETEYTNSVHAIDQELENDKKELENMKNSLQMEEDKFDKTRNEFYSMDKTYKENETVKDLLAVRRMRLDNWDYYDKIEELKNDPKFEEGSHWTYGENDGWIREKYPWIEELVNKYVDIPSYNGQPGYDMILDEDIVNGLDSRDDELAKEIENKEKELPQEIAQVYHGYLDILKASDVKKAELRENIPLLEEKVNENLTKREEANATYERKSKYAVSNYFNPDSVINHFNGKRFSEFQGDYKTFPDQVDRVIKFYDGEIQTKKENIAKIEPQYKEAMDKAGQARKEFDDGEKQYRRQKLDLEAKEIEAEEKKKWVKSMGYNAVKPLVDAFANTYKETFNQVPNKDYVEMVPLIQQQAAEWLKIEGLHSGKHKNSIEYDRMIDALKIVRDWPKYENHIDKFPESKVPGNFDMALALVKEQAENYQKEKNKQWRPFPSRLRTHRNNMTKFILGFVEKAQKGIEAQREVISLDNFIQTKGRSEGLDLGKDDLIKEVMEIAKIELPKETLKETQAVKTETSKEETKMNEPEMEDEGMGMR